MINEYVKVNIQKIRLDMALKGQKDQEDNKEVCHEVMEKEKRRGVQIQRSAGEEFCKDNKCRNQARGMEGEAKRLDRSTSEESTSGWRQELTSRKSKEGNQDYSIDHQYQLPFNPGVKSVGTPEKGANHLEARETGVSQADTGLRQEKNKGSVERERRVKRLISQRDHDYGKRREDRGNQRRRKNRRRKGRGKKSGKIMNDTNGRKIGYANVQGKMGIHREEVWQEWAQVIKQNKWDIAIMVETHWQGGINGRSVEGYFVLDRQRDATAKKGGGLAVLVREGTAAVEWSSAEQGEGEARSELMWVIFPTVGVVPSFALGVVYLSSGRSIIWNEHIGSQIWKDIIELRSMGHLLIGDFNGHVRKLKETREGIDENGRMVVNLEKELGLSVVNWSEKCKGSWTRAKNLSKSFIDYVIACPDMYHDVKLMVVDE